MIKTITKIGRFHAVIFDAALLNRAQLKADDELKVQVQADGRITLTPIRRRSSRQGVSKVIKATMKSYASTMRKLA